MINFCLSIDYTFKKPYLLFSSSSQRDERCILTGIFDGHIKLEYFKSLSHQLTEIIREKRISLDENDKLVPSPNSYFHCVLEVDSKTITLTDLEKNQQIRLKAIDFKKLIDNWIKYVEVNTDAFSSEIS